MSQQMGQWPFQEQAHEMTAAQWLLLTIGMNPIELTEEVLDGDGILDMIERTFS